MLPSDLQVIADIGFPETAKRVNDEIESLRQQLAEANAKVIFCEDRMIRLEAKIADLTARLEASEEGLTIAYMSGRYDKRKADEAHEASEPVACSRCGGSGIVPIGDGYSVDPCPVCKVMGVPRVLGHAGENDIGQLPPPVMGGSPLSQDGGKQTCAGTASHPVSQEASEPVFYALRDKNGIVNWHTPSPYPLNADQLDRYNSGFKKEAPFENVALFTTPQPTPTPTVKAAVAAALRKAAELFESKFVWNDADTWWYREAAESLLAIPHDDSALREICMRVADEVHTEGDIGGVGVAKRLGAIVNRVLGEVKCS